MAMLDAAVVTDDDLVATDAADARSLEKRSEKEQT